MALVLVVDNDSIARSQYISGLQQAGHSVTGASSAQATLDAIDEIKPDIIVLDIVISFIDSNSKPPASLDLSLRTARAMTETLPSSLDSTVTIRSASP